LRRGDTLRQEAPAYERRPDTDQARSEQDAKYAVDGVAEASLDAVSELREQRPPYLRGSSTLRGRGIPPELVRTRRLDLRGHVVNVAHDIRGLAQAARDPRFEAPSAAGYSQRREKAGLQSAPPPNYLVGSHRFSSEPEPQPAKRGIG
jgi:hypothetical protein